RATRPPAGPSAWAGSGKSTEPCRADGRDGSTMGSAMRPGARSGYTDRRNRSGDGRSRLQLPMQDKDITPEGGCGCAKTRNGRDMLSADRQRPFRDKTCVSRQGPGGYRNGCCCIVKEMGTKPVKSSTAHAVQKRRSRLVAMMITPTA